MSGTSVMEVISVPSDAHTDNNFVFVSEQNFRQLQATASGTWQKSHLGYPDVVLVEINRFPFSAMYDPLVKVDAVAMNSIQRVTASVTTGGCVQVSVLPSAPLGIVQVTFSLQNLRSRKGGEVNCNELASFFQSHFRGQCFRSPEPGVTPHMLAVVLESGMRLSASVASMVTTSPHEVVHGSLDASTSIFFAASEESGLVLTGLSDAQMDAQQSQLLHNFNLEDMGIGGLRNEFSNIFRRAFASRIFPASYIKKIGIKHVKGVLLYGPPGTGKTLIARKIGEMLNCHPPKIVNGPEVFNKFVGGTEENIRKLFVDAEEEQASKGDRSRLHLLIFDEFDAICKQRGAVRDSTGVADNVVNQLLSKIDGVNSLNNVLLIGMTNRLDLIDEAILRPGRFEIHIEIGLPNEEGRVEIFRIHTKGMRDNGIMAKDVRLETLAGLTKNYSGAEIEGVVRAATANAFHRHIDVDNPGKVVDEEHIQVTRQDFTDALIDVPPAFGQAKEECASLRGGGILHYGPLWQAVVDKCEHITRQFNRDGTRINSLGVLIDGEPGSGKSAAAAYLAEVAGCLYVKVISSESMVGYGELQKVNIIRKAFDDASKSSSSCIILDDLERLIELSLQGSRYSNALLQALLVLIKRAPADGKKLLVIATTGQRTSMQNLELTNCFNVELRIPLVPAQSLPLVISGLKMKVQGSGSDMDPVQRCVNLLPPEGLPMKQLLLLLEMSVDGVSDAAIASPGAISCSSFEQALYTLLK